MDWTWKQRLRFFMTGTVLTALATLGPVGTTIWYWLVHWNDTPLDWKYLRTLILSCMAVPVLQYVREHRALLKIPPGLILPPEFAPSMKSKSVEVDVKVGQTSAGQPVIATTKTTIEKEAHLAESPPDKPAE